MDSKANQRMKFNTTPATPKKSVTEVKADINKILKESTDGDVNDVKELYKEYVVDFIESGVEGSPLSFDEFTEEVTTDEHIDAETHLKKFLENI